MTKIESTSLLWEPMRVGALRLNNRLVMAPLTRNRATPSGEPTAMNAEYYAQRATLGLIITEGTQPSADGQGYLLTPGIHTDAQVAGWRQVQDAVHAAGGQIVIQLMHTGRISHPSNTPHGRPPLAPSAIRAQGQIFTASGLEPMAEPRALSESDIAQTVQDYAHAAQAAITAGLDGVEIHGASGYLPHQFLSSNANQRTDRYGGSIENRIRFLVEVTTAVALAIGPERTGLRIAPGNPFNDLMEEQIPELYQALLQALAPLGLAYLHVTHTQDEALLKVIRQTWPGILIYNRVGADLETRVGDLESGLADAISVGVMALANPDLVERLKSGAPLNAPDQSTFYGGGEHGYTDYPTLHTSSDH